MSNSFYSKCALLQFGGKKGAVGGTLASFSIPAFLPCPYSLFTDTDPNNVIDVNYVASTFLDNLVFSSASGLGSKTVEDWDELSVTIK